MYPKMLGSGAEEIRNALITIMACVIIWSIVSIIDWISNQNSDIAPRYPKVGTLFSDDNSTSEGFTSVVLPLLGKKTRLMFGHASKKLWRLHNEYEYTGPLPREYLHSLFKKKNRPLAKCVVETWILYTEMFKDFNARLKQQSLSPYFFVSDHAFNLSVWNVEKLCERFNARQGTRYIDFCYSILVRGHQEIRKINVFCTLVIFEFVPKAPKCTTVLKYVGIDLYVDFRLELVDKNGKPCNHEAFEGLGRQFWHKNDWPRNLNLEFLKYGYVLEEKHQLEGAFDKLVRLPGWRSAPLCTECKERCQQQQSYITRKMSEKWRTILDATCRDQNQKKEQYLSRERTRQRIVSYILLALMAGMFMYIWYISLR